MERKHRNVSLVILNGFLPWHDHSYNYVVVFQRKKQKTRILRHLFKLLLFRFFLKIHFFLTFCFNWKWRRFRHVVFKRGDPYATLGLWKPTPDGRRTEWRTGRLMDGESENHLDDRRWQSRDLRVRQGGDLSWGSRLRRSRDGSTPPLFSCLTTNKKWY